MWCRPSPLLVLFRLDVITYHKLCGVLLMTVGMVIACYTEPTFSVKGLVLMFVGEAAEAMRMVFFQHLLGSQQFGLIEVGAVQGESSVYPSRLKPPGDQTLEPIK